MARRRSVVPFSFLIPLAVAVSVSVFRLLLLGGSLLAVPALAQSPTNDGFQRRDGTMYVIRNGQKRPMTRDAHLPNGRTITRDGFVVERDGQRTELTEGRGCTLAGTGVVVAAGQDGQVVLAAAPRPQPARVVSVQSVSAQAYLSQLLGSEKRRGWGYYKKGKRGKGKGRKHDD